jgi:transglutaminase-like putative cysteine protease
MAGLPPALFALRGILFAYLLSCATGVVASVASQKLLPEQSTVVLLAGLPGDSESENAYREQLQGWLNILAAHHESQRVFALCDHPELLTLPATPTTKTMAANRANFLELGLVLSGATNPVVVIAFGHGGRQGTTPVLHVSGPRITSADFSALAAKLNRCPSRWILLFRGSGAFAHALAGEGRQIFSSECDTPFTSDPIGMPVLLRIVQVNPTISFEEMGAKAGKAIADWYSSRNLARTEEPTFWDGDSKPRLMASSMREEVQPGKNSSEELARGTKLESQGSELPDGERHDARGAELPAIWKDIKPVKRSEYLEVDGVVLRRSLRCVIGSNPAIATEQDEYVQVLSTEGKTLGDIDVSYSRPDEDLEFLDCEVLRPDGRIVRLDPETIGQSHELAAGDYQAERRQFFSLPEIVPGAVLHVRYRTQWKEFPLPHVAMALPISEELPVLDSTIQVSVPKDTPFHFLFEEVAASDPVVTRTSYSTSYRWHFEKQAERRREILSSPYENARLLFSTFSDWKAFTEWYGRISKLADEATPEIVAKAHELTRDARNDREKVEAVYNYVTALRYVAVPLGVNSLRPHAAANVLKHQFGDCKDKANLLNALLHGLSLNAQLVLVPRFSRAYDLVPGVGFNHAISRLNLDGETMWVDTTDDVCRFGLLPPGDPGRKVLVIDGQTTTLTQLPEPDPRDHQLYITGELEAVTGEDAWPARLSARAQGYPDYELREVARETKDKYSATPLLAARFRPVNGSFGLDQQSASSLSAMTEDFSWRAQGAFVGLSSVASGKRLLRAPVWLPKEWDSALHRRRSPLFLNQGYPLTLDEQFTVELPAGLPVIELPACRENNEAPLRWRMEWARVGDDKLVPHFHAQLVRGELSLDETVAFQKQLRGCLTALGVSACFGSSP